MQTPVVDDAEIEAAVRTAAKGTGVAFEVVACDPALADTAAFCEAYGYAMDDSANCVVVIGKADPPVYAACVVLATTRLDVNGAVRRRLGTRKASFAPADAVEAMTGMTVGGVTPFSLPDGMPLWVDARVLGRERIILGGGSRSCKVLAPPSILVALGGEIHDERASGVGFRRPPLHRPAGEPVARSEPCLDPARSPAALALEVERRAARGTDERCRGPTARVACPCPCPQPGARRRASSMRAAEAVPWAVVHVMRRFTRRWASCSQV